MPWATADAAEPGEQRARLAGAVQSWEAGTVLGYPVVLPRCGRADEGTAIGPVGLHRRNWREPEAPGETGRLMIWVRERR